MRMRTLLTALSTTMLLALGATASITSFTAVAADVPLDVDSTMNVAAPAPQLTRDDLEPWLDGLLDYGLVRADVAGAVVVVVKDGHVLLKKGYGYADVAGRRPVDPDTTLFRPGSISKLFTWTAVMQLVEQGKIDLDGDINAYLDFQIPSHAGHPITMRNLMTHSPGFEDSYKDLYSTPDKEVIDLARFIKKQVPARMYPPGEVTAYSNYGVALAGYIVQRVSGQNYDDYIEQHILTPLQMTRSSLRQPLPAPLLPLMSNGYAVASEKPKPYEIIGPAPAGSLAATGADMAKFMIAHLQGGEYEGARILRPETTKVMHDSASTVISPLLNRNVLGFMQNNRNGVRIISHGGDSQWFHSQLALFQDFNIGIFVSMNSRGRDQEVSAVRKALLDGFVDRYFPAAALPPAAVAPQLAQDHAAMIAGQYDNSRREDSTIWSLMNLSRQIEVFTDGSGIITASSHHGLNEQPTRYQEIAPFLWREIGGQELLAAKVKDGRVVMWASDEGATGAMNMRTPFYRNAVWLWPLLCGAFAVLLITAVLWPVNALLRSRFVTEVALSRTTVLSNVLARAGGLCAGLVMLGWFQLVNTMSRTKDWGAAWEPWVMGLHLISIIVFPGAVLLAFWNLWRLFSAERGPTHVWLKGWSVVLLLAALTLCWVAVAFRLIGFNTAY